MTNQALPSAFAGNAQFDIPEQLARRYRSAGWWNDRTLADGIEAAATRHPHSLAVVDADTDRQVTYATLAELVARATARLRSLGIDGSTGSVLVAGNNVDAVVVYHALLRAGVPTLLLDRRCGSADVQHAFEVLPRAALVVSASERDRLADVTDDRQVVLDESLSAPGAVAPRDGPEIDRDAPAVVLFTSGTTKRPKAVVHSLNSLTAGAANMARITGTNESARVFLVSPLTSIAGVMQMHLTADAHAALVLEDHFEPGASLDRIDRYRATLLGGAPVIAERLLRAAQDRDRQSVALRTVALGGAMLPRPLLELATDAFGIEIARVYGSSEAPNFSGSLPGDEREQRLSDDGLLMPGNEVHLGASAHAQEGLLRGPCLFLGYADRDDQAEAFEAGWFRTGDLMELHEQRLTVIGRLKAVANRSGLKVSLDEIDGALAGMPGVREHTSVALPDSETGERLAVALLPDGDATVTLDDVVAHLLSRGIARRKLPEELMIWDTPLPRTTSGKIVRSRVVMESATRPSFLADRLREPRTVSGT